MLASPGEIGDMENARIAFPVGWQQQPKIKDPIWSVTLQWFGVADVIPLCDLVSATLAESTAELQGYVHTIFVESVFRRIAMICISSSATQIQAYFDRTLKSSFDLTSSWDWQTCLR